MPTRLYKQNTDKTKNPQIKYRQDTLLTINWQDQKPYKMESLQTSHTMQTKELKFKKSPKNWYSYFESRRLGSQKM